MNNDAKTYFKKEPSVNVISKEVFEERVSKVFHLLWETLSKSFGPYGAPTLIYNYPFSHVTKDGFTIMKNLSMDVSETLLDQAIADMASDICGRLNYSVGDGTTSAVIATNSIYNSYQKYKDELNDKYILPRDIISKYNDIKSRLIELLNKKTIPIRSDNMDELEKNIRDVVYISSNGDEVLTDYISKLYKDIGCPGITSKLSSDGITRAKLINGYQLDLVLNDKIYINSDNDTMDLGHSDIIIFSKKVTKTTYERILKPINIQSKLRGRHLIVAAPFYDEVAVTQTIAPELNAEYKKTKNVNMVLTTYKATSPHARHIIEDFSILMNTTVIGSDLERKIIDDSDRGIPIFNLFNIDERNIEGAACLAYNDETTITFVSGEDEEELKKTNEKLKKEGKDPYEILHCNDDAIRLGFSRSCSLGLKSSLFTGDMVYSEEMYKTAMRDATKSLAELEAKYQKLGTFNTEVALAQQRLYALKLKMGVIEIGADSELSQKMLKDSVDDAIKAAASAFNHGVVAGCNVNLIQVIQEMIKEVHQKQIDSDTNDVYYVDSTLLNILYNGFIDVYKTVLKNAFEDIKISHVDSDPADKVFLDEFGKIASIKNKTIDEIFDDAEAFSTILTKVKNHRYTSIHEIIINYSLITGKVFDVSEFKFTNKVINSVETDRQILKAVIDLISLLITGNQMVVTQKRNFE